MGGFAASVAVGFALAAPIGPVSVLCMREVLLRGWRIGLAVALGAAVGDAAAAAFAGFGMMAVPDASGTAGVVLRLLLGIAIVALGLHARRHPVPAVGTPRAGGFVATFLLTVGNPLNAAAFAAAFSTLRLMPAHGATGVLATSSGVAVGAGLWWTTLAIATDRCRDRLDELTLRGIARSLGTVLLAGGIAMTVAAVVESVRAGE